MEYSDLDQLTKLIRQRGGGSNPDQARSMMVQSSFLKKQGKNAQFEEEEEEAVYFDQTSKHIGSISKNMLFSHKADGAMDSRVKMSGGITEGTLVNYTLDSNANQLSTYMVDIKDKAQQHNMRFGRGKRNDSDVNDGDGARANSNNVNMNERQPQDRQSGSSESVEYDEVKSHNSEADALYSDVEDGLNVSFEKEQEDTEGATSSFDKEDPATMRNGAPRRPQKKKKKTKRDQEDKD